MTADPNTEEAKPERAGLSPAVTVAVVGALSALLGSGLTAFFNNKGSLEIEKQRAVESEKLARQEFETKLIMQAVQGATPEVATKNLQFFLKAGFIDDPSGKIAKLSAEAPPEIAAPGTNLSGLSMKDTHACSTFAAREFKGAAKPLTDQDIQDVATQLGLDLPTFRAVLDVETESPFKNGRPLMLFERHIFSRLTHGTYDQAHADISNPAPGGYGAPGDHQYDRLKEAMALDCGAALGATSWGMAQGIGITYQQAGYANLDDMIGQYLESGRAQLDGFAHYLQQSNLVNLLRNRQWEDFARRYNGPGQIALQHAAMLDRAYKKHASQK